jgi:TolB protein
MLVVLLLVVIILGLLTVIFVPQLMGTYLSTQTPAATQDPSSLRATDTLQPTIGTPQPTATLFVVAPQSTPLNALTPNPDAQTGLSKEGVIILAMRDGNYSHLFAYHPLYLPLTRLSDGKWDDITPSLSSDGARIIFSSNRDGQWDLYLLDLQTSTTSRLTNSPEYDASPSWSPDGQWIVYESYVPGGNLEIIVRSVSDPNTAPIQLTDNPAADHSPAWSPGGREIAFVSSRSGDEEIWVARLDNLDQRFINLSNRTSSADMHPSWSADGRYLAWSAEQDGTRSLVIWDREKPDFPAAPLGSGSWPAWSPDGSLLVSEVASANQVAFSGYRRATGRLEYPLVTLPGQVYGLDWNPTCCARTSFLPIRNPSPHPCGRKF